MFKDCWIFRLNDMLKFKTERKMKQTLGNFIASLNAWKRDYLILLSGTQAVRFLSNRTEVHKTSTFGDWEWELTALVKWKGTRFKHNKLLISQALYQWHENSLSSDMWFSNNKTRFSHRRFDFLPNIYIAIFSGNFDFYGVGKIFMMSAPCWLA